LDATQFSLIGALVVLVLVNLAALVWASLQDRKARAKPQPKIYEIHLEGTKVFSDVELAEIQKQAKDQLASAARDAAVRLQKSLNNSVDQVAANINESLGTDLRAEFEKYQVSLSALRDQTVGEFTKIQQELDHRKLELLEHLEREIADERARRVDAFNTRLGDVVSSYLTESLGNQVDLGAQTTYIVQVLEEHKEDIKRDVLS
jgi:hypothetical protein